MGTRLMVGAAGAWCAAAVVGCSSPAPDLTYTQVYGLKDSGADSIKNTDEWKCLDNPTPAVAQTAQQYQLTGVIVDYQTHNPVSAQMRACVGPDFPCDPGAAQGVPLPTAPTLPLPAMTVTLAAGFTGFLRITAPNYFPYDYYIGGPITKPVTVTQPFPLVTATSFAGFAAGIKVDPMEAGALGTLGVQVYNCLEEPAAGVSLAFSDQADDLKEAVQWAQQDGYPVLTELTDMSGTTGFVKLPLRNISVEAVIGTTHFGKRTFPIAPGRLTTGVIRASGYANGY